MWVFVCFDHTRMKYIQYNMIFVIGYLYCQYSCFGILQHSVKMSNLTLKPDALLSVFRMQLIVHVFVFPLSLILHSHFVSNKNVSCEMYWLLLWWLISIVYLCIDTSLFHVPNRDKQYMCIPNISVYTLVRAHLRPDGPLLIPVGTSRC